MKKYLILMLLASVFAVGHAKPNITDVSFPASAKQFELYEIAFQLDNYANPYDPEIINVYAEFMGPDGKTLTVNGFYYESYTFEKYQDYERASAGRDKGWRVRFTPNMSGSWSFRLHAIDKKGKTELSSIGSKPFQFRCESVDNTQGFIRKANNRYLKQEVVANGQQRFQPFYPAGPNIAWYSYVGSSSKPRGIYDYESYIDSITGSANFMRIWLNRYQCLNLYGPESTQKVDKKTTVYFNSTLNQKDAAELDHIVAYARRKGINLMPCIFTFGDYSNINSAPSIWDNNPFHTILGLKSPNEFFTDKEAKRITKNLIRYIVARWGYATNIMCWELWNEVNNHTNGDLSVDKHGRNIVDWHNEMQAYIRSIDPYHHLITTSLGTFSTDDYMCQNLFKSLDIVQIHTYGNIQKAKSKEQRSHQLMEKSIETRALYPDKLFFVGEFGFGQSRGNPKYQDKDPYGFDTHNCLWSSLFSGSMGSASFWFWDYLSENKLLCIYRPILNYIKNLPVLSDRFVPRTTASIKKNATVFPNGIQTYYLINDTEDSLYGWCQDSVFSYQSLRRQTDRVGKNGHFDNEGVFDAKSYVYSLDANKKPKPCSNSNTIILPIESQPKGATYSVRWFDGETGLEIVSERTTVTVKSDLINGRHIAIEFPSLVRDLKKKQIRNAFGDAAFIITLDQAENNTGSFQKKDAAGEKQKTIRVKRDTVRQ